MAQTPWTGLLSGSSTPLLATGDVVAFVDVSDATQSPSGSLVKTTVAAWLAALPSAVNITSASATSLAVGRLGSTTPAFTVDSSTASQVAGLKVTGAATGGTVAVVTTDSGADTNLTVNAKGVGTIGIGSVSTGRVTITPVCTITGLVTLTAGVTGPLTVTTTSASGLAVGRQGATDPVLKVDASTGSVATGIEIVGAAAAGGVNVRAISSGAAENLTLNAKGTGTITIGSVSTGAITMTRATSFSATVGVGTAAVATCGVIVSSSLSDGTSNVGVASQPLLTATTGAFNAFEARVRTDAAAITATSAIGVAIVTATKGAGSTITTLYGMYVENMSAGDTNYAVYTNAGLVRFGDAVTMASTLDVQGAENKFGGNAVATTRVSINGTDATSKILRWQSAGVEKFALYSAATSHDLKLDTATVTAFSVSQAGTLTTKATAAGAAGLNLPHGTAPAAPVDGDMWTTTAGLFVRINGSTVGPLS